MTFIGSKIVQKKLRILNTLGLRPCCSATNYVKFVQKICNATNFSYICNVNNN